MPKSADLILSQAIANLPLVQRGQRIGNRVASKEARADDLSWVPEDWPSFARLTKIRSGTKMIPFEPYDFQIKINDLIDRTRGTLIVKPRQHGLTEFVASKFLHKACLYPTYFAAVFSKGQDDTANIARRVRLMAASANIPLASNNVKDLSVRGGGRIVFKTASPDSGRGLESVWDILFDECAFVSDIANIYGAATPAQSIPEQQGMAKTILLSTPNMKRGFYYDVAISHNGDRDILKVCADMRQQKIDPYQEWVDDNNWGKALVHWRAHPVHGLNDDYLNDVRTKQRITESQVQREYNLSFEDPQTGNIICRAFNPTLHVLTGRDVEPVSYHPGLELHLSLDFNINPACSIVAQMHGKEVRVIREFYLPDSDTFVHADRIAQWVRSLPGGIPAIYLYGDASGNQRTANSRNTNWEIVADTFRRLGLNWTRRYGKANPSIQDSVNSVNYAFENDLIYVNGDACPELITDLLEVKWNGDQIDKRDINRTHPFDCLRYLVDTALPYGNETGGGRIRRSSINIPGMVK